MKLGLLFPGQGSQSVGMGQQFVAKYPLAKEIFSEANAVLGIDLEKLCREGPEDALRLTYNAQAAILTVSVIALRVLQERVAVKPVCVAGHSMGEYSALVAVGALPFSEAVRAVFQRGRFMQEATPVGTGAMAAILGASPEEVEDLCASEAGDEVVSAANFNAPGQIVISGHAPAVQRVLARARGKLLPVSAPFHCALMQPAADKMAAVLAECAFAEASAPVVNNVDNRLLSQAEEFTPSLVRQITDPVRWDTGVGVMIGQGVEHLLELGHGRILSGLMKRIDKTVPVWNAQDDESLENTLIALERA